MSHDAALSKVATKGQEVLDQQMQQLWTTKQLKPRSCPERVGCAISKKLTAALVAGAKADSKVVILMGHRGFGKTTLLSHCAQASGVDVLYSFAPAFQRQKHYSTVSNVVLAYLKLNGCTDPAAMQKKVKEMLGATKLFELAAELNHLLYLDFPSTAASHEIDTHGDATEIEHMRDCAQRCLMLELMWKIAADKKNYRIIIDDGLYIDEGSFSILHDVLNKGEKIVGDYDMMPSHITDFVMHRIGKPTPPVLIIIATRSFEHNDHVLGHAIGPAYNELAECESAEVLSVGELDESQITGVICTEFGGSATSVSKEMVAFMVKATHSNALFVKDMTSMLKSQDLLSITGAEISMKAGAENKVDIPIHMDKLGCIWSDRLSITEKVMVKTAAYLPAVFTIEQLKACFPFDYMKDSLQEEMDEVLSSPGLIERVGDGYRFCSPMTPKIFKKMMVESHRAQLEAAVKKAFAS